MTKLGVCTVLLFCAAVISAPAQTFVSLYDFCSQANCTDGYAPYAGLVQGTDGSLYGTNQWAGVNDAGTLFKITPAGHLTTLYNFCSKLNCTDGSYPFVALVLGTDGSFYGTTIEGGTGSAPQCEDVGCGTIFRVSPNGTLTTLYNFCSQSDCTDGLFPEGALVEAADGSFYGTTSGGGTNTSCPGDCGTVFRFTPPGTLTTLYSFCALSNCADGSVPVAGLVQASDGNFYGTTYQGGTADEGTVFQITSTGTLTTLYSFCSQIGCTDGNFPRAGLVQGTDGNLYGTTNADKFECVETCGTVFKITTGGDLTTLHTFCLPGPCVDGSTPYSGLVQATDGNFYGTTAYGGGNGNGGGTVFKITSEGALTTLYSFCGPYGCPDGYKLWAGVTQATNGTFYGTALEGGNISCLGQEFGGCGTVFSLSVGLHPFVEVLPGSGRVGAHVIILGNSLMGTTSVTFGGTAASFTVASNTLINATIPAGAAAGFVTVTTPGGTRKSNAKFRVVR